MASTADNKERWSCRQCKMTLAGVFMHDSHEDVGRLSEAPSRVVLCCAVMMHRYPAERHVRASVWLQRNTDGRDVEGGYHQSSALGQFLHHCCLDYEDLTLEVLPTPPDE